MSGRSVLPPRLDGDGRHLCTAVDDCDGVAVVQWPVDCDGCQDVAAAARAQADAVTAERDKHLAAMAEIVAAVRARDDGKATPDEAARYVVAHDLAAAAGSESGPHLLAAALHAGPHTHPVFACTDHEGA